jgi:RNA polymerase sigma-70 factor (ECF subfamily)
LKTWLRVVIKRCGLNLERSSNNSERQYENDQLEDKLISVGTDPELDYLKLRYAHEFKRAFRAALQQLEARDTLVLKMHVCEGARTGEIARFFGVNRVTVIRWMNGIRQGLLASTQRHLEQELRLSRAEFESIVRLVITSLNVTLSGLNESSLA